jgi:hypothetical protein
VARSSVRVAVVGFTMIGTSLRLSYSPPPPAEARSTANLSHCAATVYAEYAACLYSVSFDHYLVHMNYVMSSQAQCCRAGVR